jgi:hypothetical protein
VRQLSLQLKNYEDVVGVGKVEFGVRFKISYGRKRYEAE